MMKLVNLKCIISAQLKSKTCFHTARVLNVDQKWRQEKRLAENPNMEGPLTNLPDFTYMDGRPTPLGQRQKRRVFQQRDMAQQILTGNQELKFAVDRHQKIQESEKNKRQSIFDNKLKPKGHLLLKKEK
ncbi:unnamed protein product [Diamesa tonsa]